MSKVLKADCSVSDAYVTKNLSLAAPWKVQFDVAIPTATFTALAARHFSADLVNLVGGSGGFDGTGLTGNSTAGVSHTFSFGDRNWLTDWTTSNPANTGAAFVPDTWLRSIVITYDGSNNIVFAYAGTTLFSYNEVGVGGPSLNPLDHIKIGGEAASHITSEIYYIDNVKVYDASNSLVFTDGFESGTLAAWDSTTGNVSVVDDPYAPPGPPPGVTGRVAVAFDDGPLVASPTWTAIDQGGAFPVGFVSGFDLTSGRQTLLAQTDTGTATVYINDHDDGLFDPRNAGSPYFGKLAGKQILLQLYEPVSATWEPQFQGWIKRVSYDIDGSAVDGNGDPINASIQLECDDVFEKVGGYGLTPGVDGVFPLGTSGGSPAGGEDGVWYAETAGTVDDRIIEILTDVGIDSTRYIVASGNVRLKAVKYDPGESALVALRDACDAELPFIANMYVNRHGQFVFRGRYSRFYPDDVAAEPGSQWDFTRWAVGDGKAILSDPSRAQMRVLSYAIDDDELINVAGAWPQDIAAVHMPGQWFADPTSITDYGQHAAPPMSDLLTLNGATTGNTGNVETALYGELLVKNKKDPREAITSLQVKTLRPDDPRAAATWPLIAKADISHIINVAVGYPSGTGFTGDSPADDHYIEGRQMRVRPLTGAYDYVEVDYETSPAIWSMDTHLVFPNPFA